MTVYRLRTKNGKFVTDACFWGDVPTCEKHIRKIAHMPGYELRQQPGEPFPYAAEKNTGTCFVIARNANEVTA